MKRVLHFATKLISKDIKKCKFWEPSYDLLVSARKALFPAPTSKFAPPHPPPPNQKFLDPPLNGKLKETFQYFKTDYVYG